MRNAMLTILLQNSTNVLLSAGDLVFLQKLIKLLPANCLIYFFTLTNDCVSNISDCCPILLIALSHDYCFLLFLFEKYYGMGYFSGQMGLEKFCGINSLVQAEMVFSIIITSPNCI